MTNQERAVEVIWKEQRSGIVKLRDLVDALADAGLIMPDLPDFGGASYLDVEDLKINVVNKSSNVLIEWESDSDYFYGKRTRSLWLNRNQVLAIIAAANLAEKSADE